MLQKAPSRAGASFGKRPWGCLLRSGPRLRKRRQRRAQLLPEPRQPQHAEIVEAAAGDLQADRQALRRHPGRHRDRRLVRHIRRQSEADMLEGPGRIVDRRGQLRRIARHRRNRRDHEIEGRALLQRRIADRDHLAHAAIDARARSALAALRPGEDIGQHLRLLLRRQCADIGPGALAPEIVEPVQHLARQEGRRLLDDRAGIGEGERRGLDRGLDLGLDRQADAGIELEPDAQALRVEIERQPVDLLRRQAHAVARIGPRQLAHHQGGIR